MNYKDRIEVILKNYNLTILDFCQKISIQRSNLSHIYSGRNKPSILFLEKINNYFPNINMNWFISGEGEAFKKKESIIHKKDKNEKEEFKTKSLSKNNNKNISRIVILYDDGTFEQFLN